MNTKLKLDAKKNEGQKSPKAHVETKHGTEGRKGHQTAMTHQVQYHEQERPETRMTR